jgi:RNA-directed DNA polymerase
MVNDEGRMAMADLMGMLTAPENLLSAWRAVRGNVPRVRRRHSAGPDGVTLAEFERDLSAQLNALRDMLLHSRYEPAPPKVIQIAKPNGGERTIGVLNVRDRVAQRAAEQVLAPLWEPEFLECNFGFRPGRGTPHALAYARQMRAEGCEWVVEGDIEDCFGSLDHDLLLKRVTTRVDDRCVIALVTRWLDVGALGAGLPDDTTPEESVQGWQKMSGNVKRGLMWALDAALPGVNGPMQLPPPRPIFRDEARYDARDGVRRERYDVPDWDEAQYEALVVTGAAAGVAWLRPNIGQTLYRVRRVAESPMGRRMMRSGSLVMVGLAGVAAVSAVTALAVNRLAGPAPLGVIQGSPLSPLMANVYLHPFDCWMTKRGHRLVRYADDIMVLAESETRAESAYNDTLHGMRKLRLKMNRRKIRIVRPGEQCEFLGEIVK